MSRTPISPVRNQKPFHFTSFGVNESDTRCTRPWRECFCWFWTQTTGALLIPPHWFCSSFVWFFGWTSTVLCWTFSSSKVSLWQPGLQFLPVVRVWGGYQETGCYLRRAGQEIIVEDHQLSCRTGICSFMRGSTGALPELYSITSNRILVHVRLDGLDKTWSIPRVGSSVM